MPDRFVTTTEKGSRAVLWSFAALLATAVLQAVVVLFTGSVGLLADTIHNLGDAGTAIPLWIAFRLARKRPSDRFTYGYGRIEDLAGVIVVVVILASAVAAAAESIYRFVAPVPVRHLWAVAAASAVGFLGNEAVAVYRLRVGKEIGSAALVADGRHAHADALTSLAVTLGAGGVWLGYPVADPAAGLVISAIILRIVWQTGNEVFLRLLDGSDPSVAVEIRETASAVPGVVDVSDVRVRWAGHRMYAEVNLAVKGDRSVREGHAIAKEVRHRMLHGLRYLSDAVIHVDPAEASGTENHSVPSHRHDDLPGHSH
ncbi:MAG TPA: cation diffusion facilitator family transporter [Candidatus Bathyarchaeia archaeon]|nr:cation diffusion facilitator family transporter [Candidatus Bathyarchaeia archaeon]